MLPEARIGTAHGKMGEEQLSRDLAAAGGPGDRHPRLHHHHRDRAWTCPTATPSSSRTPTAWAFPSSTSCAGRVGRSTRRAYAYFTFRRGKVLTEVAAKRLSAIREFTAVRFGLPDRHAGPGDPRRGQHPRRRSSTATWRRSGYDMYLQDALRGGGRAEGRGARRGRPRECMVDIRVERPHPRGLHRQPRPAASTSTRRSPPSRTRRTRWTSSTS